MEYIFISPIYIYVLSRDIYSEIEYSCILRLLNGP